MVADFVLSDCKPLANIYLFLYMHVAQIPGTAQDHLQIFNIELKTKIKSHQMPEQVFHL